MLTVNLYAFLSGRVVTRREYDDLGSPRPATEGPGDDENVTPDQFAIFLGALLTTVSAGFGVLFKSLLSAKDAQVAREQKANDALLPAQRETTATLQKVLDIQTLNIQQFDRLNQRLERIERLDRPGRARSRDEGE